MTEDEQAKSWAETLSSCDNRQGKDLKAALLAMPLAYPGTGQYHTNSSTSVKQYAIHDLEREGLVQLVEAMQMVNDYIHGAFTLSRAVPAPEWRRTPLGDKVVDLLKGMEAAK